MNIDNEKQTVLILSNDEKLKESLSNKFLSERDGFVFDIESDAGRVRAHDNAQVIVYDLDLVGGDYQQANVDILLIKSAAPTKPLLVVGHRGDLKPVLASKRMGACIARGVTKPIAPGQLLMAINAVNSATNAQATNFIPARARQTKTAMVLSISLPLIIGVTYLLIGDQHLLLGDSQSIKENITIETDLASQNSRGVGDNDSKIALLRRAASHAYEKGHLITPSDGNALGYYNQILEIDAYDQQAYKNRQEMIAELSSSIPKLLRYDDLEEALQIVEVLISMDPYDKENKTIRRDIKQRISWLNRSRVSNEAQLDNQANKLALLSNRKGLSGEQDKALTGTSGGEFDVKLERKVDSRPLSTAKFEVPDGRQQLASVEANAVTQAEAVSAPTHAREDDPSLALTARTAIRTVTPKYPKSARNLELEGWVELAFQVDKSGNPVNIQVVQADPLKVFDKTSIKALKRWRFLPVTNPKTGEVVISDTTTTRFRFSLDG